MFSNDRNIGIVERLIEVFKHYIGLQNEYLRLDVTEKSVKILTFILVTSILFLFIALILISLSFAAACAMGPHIGYGWAFSIVAFLYLFIFLVLLLFRKRWIERPLIKFITGLLIDK